jgi:hypothetical protein
MTSQADFNRRANPPALAGTADTDWVERYYQWRLDVALADRSTPPHTGTAGAAAALEREILPALSDPALDTVDVAAFIARTRREVRARGAPAGFRLIDRSALCGRPDPEPVIAYRPPAPTSPRPFGLGQLLRRDGADFVFYAYLSVLKREPDWVGFASYLQQMNGRIEEKIEILRSLSASPEGRKRGNGLIGLRAWVLYYRLKNYLLARYGRRIFERLGSAKRRAAPGPT